MRTKHSTYQCDKCDKTFDRKDRMKRHYFIHTDEMPYQCEHCPSGFVNQRQYRIHLLSHQEQKWNPTRKYICKKCPEVFDKRSRLADHLRIVHPIVCKVCGQTFIYETYLRTHMMAIHKKLVAACEEEENCPKYCVYRRNIRDAKQVYYIVDIFLIYL